MVPPPRPRTPAPLVAAYCQSRACRQYHSTQPVARASLPTCPACNKDTLTTTEWWHKAKGEDDGTQKG